MEDLMIILALFAAMASSFTPESQAFSGQRCKVSSSSSTAMSESDADHQAWVYGRDQCWSWERSIGKTMTYDPGSSECTSRPAGQAVVWTCTYSHTECCYTI
jgi:hypothetical protein